LHKKGCSLTGSHAPAAGHSAAKMAHIHYQRYFNQQMRPPPRHVQQAVLVGGVSEEKMAGFDAASTLLHTQDWLSENG
jgi:hypothetical protein